MGKGSGTCQRSGISLAVIDSAETQLNLSGEVASVSEINTALKLQRLEGRWFTKDDQVVFRKQKEGWTAFTLSDPIRKAFEEYGLIHQQAGTSSYEHTFFPSLKTARQAVNDVSLEAELNIDSGLTRKRYVAYKIGNLPLTIRREKDHWRVLNELSPALPQSLKKHFNSTQEFRATWESIDIALGHYPTRKAAHQAVTNWLAQTIAKEIKP